MPGDRKTVYFNLIIAFNSPVFLSEVLNISFYVLQGHSEVINGMDWSLETNEEERYWLRSSSTALELKYCKQKATLVYYVYK